MGLVLNTLVEELAPLLKGKFIWVDDEPTAEDLYHLHIEAFREDYDIHGLKRSVLDDYTNGKARLVCKSGPYAKVMALVYPDTVIPWDSFALIFKAVGKPKDYFRISWFASKKKRTYPTSGILPDKGDVNGGYTIPCDTKSIVIYREEEVCRVLIHELLHATCTDTNPDIVELESEAEAWAELIWIAIRSRGHKGVAARLWKEQAQWISNTEYSLRMNHGVKDKNDYVWRYTVGRRKALHELGILLPTADTLLSGSLSFTSPRLPELEFARRR
jgi:hypothetical protein